eukprot:scaffold6188_cov99-Isochrysis_galbana.AAC.1
MYRWGPWPPTVHRKLTYPAAPPLSVECSTRSHGRTCTSLAAAAPAAAGGAGSVSVGAAAGGGAGSVGTAAGGGAVASA